ncbi:pyridoxamine 5'-phosphate oxidase family protein [Pseudomonas sp. Pseu.R1]|uniref:FAD-binding oxidoreductase n=1 Tax=Pseudomonas sp. Pseu.R1 TaxID=3379818 RepID=UPI003B93DBBC
MNEGSESDKRSPWHDGELQLQRSVDAVALMVGPGERQMARDWMPDQHRDFYAQLPFVVLGTVDGDGQPWATLRTGQPGFMDSPRPNILTLSLPAQPADPAQAGIADGSAIGLLGIELHTRRRNRMNGIIRCAGDSGFQIAVSQAYGNCPRYIKLRQFHFVDEPAGPDTELHGLDDRSRQMIARADSFFVASYAIRDGVTEVDASHRGGKPGFVRQDDDGTLLIPDFNGNLFFNTLGNLMLNPKAGLIFVDFEKGDVLQMTGDTEVLLDSPEIAAFQGAERLWRFTPQRMVYREKALGLRWTTGPDAESSSSLMTGDWPEAAQRLQALAWQDRWRVFEVVRIEDESAEIRSFHLQPVDGGGLLPYQAGQHLPVRLPQESSHDQPMIRNYSISSAPSDDFLRISVKRQGVFSSHLHQRIQLGDRLEARSPRGLFTVEPSLRRPLVLIGAGVGITPMLAMFREVIYQGQRIGRMRPTWVLQGARTVADLAFGRELVSLMERGGKKVNLLRYVSQPESGTVAGVDYDHAERITVQTLKGLLPLDDYDFYVCGPASFTQGLYDGLRAIRIPDDRIHAEAFGVSTLIRDTGAPLPQNLQPTSSTVPVKVMFAKSAKEARWEPQSGTLLELAEARGLSPEFNCRSGTCGTCKTGLGAGVVNYLIPPLDPVPNGEVLLCCSVPAPGSPPLVIDL